MIRKREPRWQSAAERARVAAELIEEAESLTETSTIASPADLLRAALPPPVTAQLPQAEPAPGALPPTPALPAAEPTLDDAIALDPDNVTLLVERAELLAGAGHYRAAQRDYERVLRQRNALLRHGVRNGDDERTLDSADHEVCRDALVAYERAVGLEPRNAKALYGLGIVLDRLNRPDAATQMYRRSREATGR